MNYCRNCKCASCALERHDRRQERLLRHVPRRDRYRVGPMTLKLSPQEGYTVSVPDVATLRSMIEAGLRLHREIER